MYDVITFGAATQDVFLRSKQMELHREHGIMEACFPFGAKIDVEEMYIETGGGGTNNAATFAKMAQMKTAVVAAVGADIAGEEIIKAMKRDQVAANFMQINHEAKTGYSAIILSGVAERTILTHRGASSLLNENKIPWNRMNARLFYISSLAGNLDLLKKIIFRGKKIKAKIFMNPGGGELRAGLAKTAKLFAQLDLLILNREETAALTGVSVKNLNGLIAALRKICPLAVLTDGRAGAYAITRSETTHAAIVPVKRVNVTGAGDAFGSAFSAGLILDKDIPACLALGTLNATSVVQKMGAKVGILKGWPSPREINKVKITKINF
jgi:ribokinase